MTSVVILVTRLAAEKLSMLANENFCTHLNWSSRRFLANPADAIAAYLPDMNPQKSDAIAATIRTVPMV